MKDGCEMGSLQESPIHQPEPIQFRRSHGAINTFSNLLNPEKHIDLLQNGPILLSSKVCLGDPKEISK